MPTDEETEAGFRVLVKERLYAINTKLDGMSKARADHEERIRTLERRALIALGFALCLSSLSAITTAVQIFAK
jgi:hypothetical protein